MADRSSRLVAQPAAASVCWCIKQAAAPVPKVRRSGVSVVQVGTAQVTKVSLTPAEKRTANLHHERAAPVLLIQQIGAVTSFHHQGLRPFANAWRPAPFTTCSPPARNVVAALLFLDCGSTVRALPEPVPLPEFAEVPLCCLVLHVQEATAGAVGAGCREQVHPCLHLESLSTVRAASNIKLPLYLRIHGRRY